MWGKSSTPTGTIGFVGTKGWLVRVRKKEISRLEGRGDKKVGK